MTPAELRENLDVLYERCGCLSGGYEHVAPFADVVAEGAGVAPTVLRDLARGDARAHPHVIFALLRNVFPDDVPRVDPSDYGRYAVVRAAWLEWGVARGFLARGGTP